MISYLSGTILVKRDKFIIVEVNQVGYQVFLSKKTMVSVPDVGNSIKLYCFQNVREDTNDLYGFSTYDQREFFETLMDIRGVGPKAALEISSLGTLAGIKDKILAGDAKLFAGIPGIGAKKAMSIILELTGKIKLLDSARGKETGDPAQDALTQLGFSVEQAKNALKSVPAGVTDMEERVKIALKSLGK